MSYVFMSLHECLHWHIKTYLSSRNTHTEVLEKQMQVNNNQGYAGSRALSSFRLLGHAGKQKVSQKNFLQCICYVFSGTYPKFPKVYLVTPKHF